jgi:hypothetical protein
MATVLLGNKGAGEKTADGWRKIPGNQITTINIPDGWDLADALRAIVHPDGAWMAHSTDEAPAWVECDDKVLEHILSTHYNCLVGRPKGWNG